MTSAVARHEFQSYLRDGRFRWAAAVTLALLVLAAVSGWAYRTQLVRERERVTAAERDRWLNQGDKWAHSAAHYGIYAFKPLNPLASLDHGIEPYVGVGVWLEAHNQNDFVHRPAEDATALQRFGELTAALVLQLLLPLFVVLLAFGAYTGERESGTLRQLLGVGVAPAALARGKALGTAAAFGAVLVPAAFLGAAALAFASAGAGGAPLARFGVLALVYLLYLGTFLAITLAVSARAPSSRFALVALLAFWGFNGLLAPRLAGEFAARLHPAPPTLEFKRQLHAELGDPHDYAELQKKKALLLAQYGVKEEKDLPVNWAGLSLQMGEERANGIFDRHFGGLFDTYRAQNLAASLAGIFAPLLAAQPASLALAGTDFEHHRDFLTVAERHRRLIQKVLNDDLAKKPDRNGERQMTGRDVYAQVADFHYAPPGVAFAIRHAWPALALLATWFAAAAWFALRSAAALRPV
jgi:ABC-2 type transport system permease protein